MKYFIFIIVQLLACAGNAQYVKLIDFQNSSTGSQPFGSVILSANNIVLYGMTNGISTGGGTIFSMRTDGANHKILHVFAPSGGDGNSPYGSLIRSGNMLYGMTAYNGQYGGGIIFSIDTAGANYMKLHDFQWKNDSIQITGGGNPYGTLTLSGNLLFGMTYGTGGLDKGNVFSIRTDGTGYKDLYHFSGADGQGPSHGPPVLSGNRIFGTTMYGGVNGLGVIFSIDTNGANYTKLFDFNSANGSQPFNTPIIIGNVLYGTAGGGVNGKGVIYSIHSDGSNFKKLHEFNGIDGQNPMGGLLIDGNLLYGTTGVGGQNNYGTVFIIDTSGSNFQTVHHFDGVNGSQPRATLTLAGNTLFGTGVTGGIYGDGVVFSLKTFPPSIPICEVTVDNNSMYNEIVWDKPLTSNMDSFIVYREITSNNYKRIGSLPFSAAAVLVDTVRAQYFPFTGDPNAGTYRYKLQVRDVNGVYSQFSPYHNTIFINHSGATFSWNHYSVEGEPTPLPSLSSYILYRDDNSTGVWNAVQGVSGSQTTVTDPNYSSYPNGRWRVETNWSVLCSSATSYNSSRSNATTSTSSGINDISLDNSVEVIWDPLYAMCIVRSLFKISGVQIINSVGQKVYYGHEEGIQAELNLDFLPAGVYALGIITEKGLVIKRIALSK